MIRLPRQVSMVTGTLMKRLFSSHYSNRSHNCGELSIADSGKRVQLSGWVQFSRLGKKFVILKDAFGMTQLQMDKVSGVVDDLPLESVLCVEGVVTTRPEDQTNPDMSTGDVEVVVDKVLDISRASPNIPFLSRDYKKAKESTQMRYRYLALRDAKLQRNLRLRSDVVMKMRQFLVGESFVDVDTPALFKRTPGGAKEFLVPSRIPSKFYSLTQSPQQFKQMMMVGGLDRYFQIAKCFRDEGGKPDRQPEFTQVDIELSFTDTDHVMKLVEDLIKKSWSFPNNLITPFPRMSHRDAMELYGSDKPDMRFNNSISDLTEIAADDDFLCEILRTKKVDKEESFVHSLCFKTIENVTAKTLSDIQKSSSKVNCVVSSFVIDSSGNVKSSLLKKCSENFVNNLKQKLESRSNAIGFLVCGPRDSNLQALGQIRSSLAKYLEFDAGDFKFLWITDFPLFERDENGNLVSAHHPFTRPHPDDINLLDSDPDRVRGLHYDLVLNGQEIAGGSIRIHEPNLQLKILKDMLQENPEELSHLIEALSYGCPPHGGIAIGLDRLIAILTNSQSIRDVIAFPKSADGRDAMSGAPTSVTDEEKKIYHIKSLDF